MSKHLKNFLFVLFFTMPFGVIACSSSKNSVFDQEIKYDDYLVYRINDQELTLFDPVNDIHTPILSNWEIDDFMLSINNRLAFTSSQEGDNNLYVLDFPFTENDPFVITHEALSENMTFSWSLDGHYLMFESGKESTYELSIWDGQGTFDIFSYQGFVTQPAWSPNEQLAFVSSNDEGLAQIYLWDGKSTVNLSQNPFDSGLNPVWSNDNQLAFLSERNGEYDIIVWDGITKDNGVPDAKTFSNIASEQTEYYSYPTWTSTNSIAFIGAPDLLDGLDTHAQIYIWDGQITRNISKNPFAHNGGQTWRSDGYWAFITFFSTEDIYIRDEENRTVLKTKGQFAPAWSQNGFLMFCKSYSQGKGLPRSWILSIWNGKDVVEIIRGGSIEAKWSNGASVFCSSG